MRQGRYASLHRWDESIMRRATRTRTRALDASMGSFSVAADHSVLWMTISGALAMFGGRMGRRAALRGMVAVGGASLIASGAAKRILPRQRPAANLFTKPVRVRRPSSSSMPSGHAASAVAFAAAVSMELPLVGVPVAVLAAAVCCSRVYNGVHYPADVALGAAIGATVAAATTKVWPLIDYERASAGPGPARTHHGSELGPDGTGLTIVANPSAGSSEAEEAAAALRELLPGAEFIALEAGADLERALRSAAASSQAIGIVGGDGSVNAAVGVALDHHLPLAVIPGGTLNHFARDLGFNTIDDAAAAIRGQHLVAVDIGTIDGKPFVNTASFGNYSKLVEAREGLENSIGKWPALLVALARVLRANETLDITIDGQARQVWMIFIGNCAYDPPGFAPAARPRLDDGLFDIRTVDGTEPRARLRLAAALLTGTLARSQVYTRRLTKSLDISVPADATTLAVDGELVEGRADFNVAKHPQQLLVYRTA